MIRSALREGSLSLVSKTKSVVSCWKQQTMSRLHSTRTNVPTAGIIVIGDEILKGQVRDSNSHFIISRLYNIGVRVMKVSVVGDDVEDISNEVRKFSHLYTYVITSGGIGPTHDDVTFEGVAKAFEENILPHPELVKICSEFYNTTDLSSPAMKLASVPESAKLKYGFDHIQNRRSKFPNISVKNVYIFPGVPPLLEKSFTMLCEDLFGGSGSKFYKSDLFISGSEVSIAENLSMAVQEFPSVSFGSYPQYENCYYSIKLTIEASNPNLLSKAVNRLKQLLPSNCLVDYDPEPLQSSYEKINSLGSEMGMDHIKATLREVLQALENSSSKDTALCIDASLSGVVTLHLVHAALQKLQRSDPMMTVLINYQESASTDKFFAELISRYSPHLVGDPGGLEKVLSSLYASHPHLKQLIAGCCCSSANLEEVLQSVTAVENICLLSPVSQWSSTQALEFVRKLNLPYLEDASIAENAEKHC